MRDFLESWFLADICLISKIQRNPVHIFKPFFQNIIGSGIIIVKIVIINGKLYWQQCLNFTNTKNT